MTEIDYELNEQTIGPKTHVGCWSGKPKEI